MNKQLYHWYRVLKNHGNPETMSQRVIMYHTMLYNLEEVQRGLLLQRTSLIVGWLNDKVIFMKPPKEGAKEEGATAMPQSGKESSYIS